MNRIIVHFLEEIAMYWIERAFASVCDMNATCRRTMRKLFRKKPNGCEPVPDSDTEASTYDSCGIDSPGVCQYGCCAMSDEFHEKLRANGGEQKST